MSEKIYQKQSCVRAFRRGLQRPSAWAGSVKSLKDFSDILLKVYIRQLRDPRKRILIDRDYCLGFSHTHRMKISARYPKADVKLRRYPKPAEPKLPSMADPAAVDRRTRSRDLRAKAFCQHNKEPKVFFASDSSPGSKNDRRVLQIPAEGW